MKGIFELRPALPKYSEIWDVNVVLNYLKTTDLSNSLTFKQLTLKLTMLLCLTTGQRGQTLHKFDVNYNLEIGDKYRITVCEKLKQTKPGRHLAPLDVLAFKDYRQLFVVEHLREYLQRTKPLRQKHSQLFLSFIKPFHPVSKDNISGWVKTVLESAGIDTSKYSAHSSIGASTPCCKAKGLNITEIMECAGGSNSGTFTRYYEKPVDVTGNHFSHVLIQP